MDRTVAVVLALAGAGVALAQSGELPPKSCVVELRSARIARTREDAAAELASLRRARAQCPDELGPMVALLVYDHRHSLPDQERDALHAALRNRLTGPTPPSTAALDQIARDPELDGEVAGEILSQLRKRLESGSDVEALRSRASIELRLGDLPAAATTLERLRAVDGSEVVTWMLIGVYRRLERWPELADLLSRMTTSDDVPVDLPVLVEALSRAGRVEETMAALDRIAATLPDASRTATALFVDLVLEAAWNLRDSGNDAAAEKLFRLALAKDPTQTQAAATLAHLYGTEEERQRHDEALADRWSTESDPYVLLEAGTQRLAAGDAAGAQELLTRAAAQLPELEAAWYNLGMAAFRQEKWSDTVTALARSTEINPQRADSFFFLGHALVKQSLWQEAIPSLVRSLELDPARTLAHYDLFLCYQATSQSELAEHHRRIYEEANAKNP